MTVFSIIMVTSFSTSPSLARSHRTVLTSLELIDRAYRNGEIDYSETLNYRVMTILRPEGLPDAYRSRMPIKSATPVILEARSNRHLLSPENTMILARGRTETLATWYGSGVELLSFISPDKHFRIHYTLDNRYGDEVPANDPDGDGIPDYVEKFADILDNVWTMEIEKMGYDAPPSDGSLGGDCWLDVYLADLPGFYGLTQIDEGMAASTVYMIFENDYSPLCSDGNNFISCFPLNQDPDGNQEGDMKVTAAHEFFHTIQFQISENITLNGWWMEASATWMEDYVYPEVNDYVNYIGEWFKRPELPLDTYNGRFEYGTAVWVKHMTEKYGSKFVFDVWRRIKDGDSALSAVENVLIDRVSTLQEELKELRVANVTFTYDDGEIFQTWDDMYGTDPIGVSYDWPCTDLSGTENFPDVGIAVSIATLAARYYCFSAPGGTGSVDLDFNGNGHIDVAVIGIRSLIGSSGGSSGSGYDATEIITDGNNDGAITINGFSSDGPYSSVVVIPLNYSTTSQSSFNLTASYSSSASGNVSSLEIMPADTSIVTGDGGLGKQQYFLISRDASDRQVLESGSIWGSDSPSVNIDSNGLAVASNAVAGVTITAFIEGLQNSATLTGNNPASMTPGAPRNCSIKNSDGRCFIATATFGSPLHPYVEILREFRDRYLLTNPAGRYMVNQYYLYSPHVAEMIGQNPALRAMVKIYLIPVIILSGFMLKTTMMGKIVAGIALIIIALFMLSLQAKRSNLKSHEIASLRLQ